MSRSPAFVRRLAVLAVGVGAALAATAQPYPSKPIKLVVGFPPGGGADGVARLVGEAVGRQLGQPVVIEYIPGAGTTLASAAVARAAPDGHTLYMTTPGLFGVDQVLYRNAKYRPKDFTPITRWAMSPMLLAVNRASGLRSVADVLAAARRSPGKLSYASSGNGIPTHIAGLYFAKAAGLDLLHVPYKGGAAAVQSVAAGDTDLTFGTPPSIQPIADTGRILPVAVTSAQRSPLFPDLPAVAESGVKGYDFSVWYALVGPAGGCRPRSSGAKAAEPTAAPLKHRR